MSPFAFDTLSAAKQLREAEMSEGVAEAVVSVFQHAATMPDISHLATKADLEALSVATKADVADMATKSDLELLRMATKADIEALGLATRVDIEALRVATTSDIDALRSSTDALRSNVDALRSEMARKSDIADMATKSDIADMATKADIAEVRLEVANLRADLQATIRQQGWLIMGGVGVVVTISNTMLKVFA